MGQHLAVTQTDGVEPFHMTEEQLWAWMNQHPEEPTEN
jgi:hypothetical protein